MIVYLVEISHTSMWKVVGLSPIVFSDMQQSKNIFLTRNAFLTHISSREIQDVSSTTKIENHISPRKIPTLILVS